MSEAAPNTRLEAFSDGVFAIAITLLVLDLKVPDLEHATPGALRDQLLRQWPSYAAFLVSFLTLLIGWISHHGLFRQLRGFTRPLLFANGLLLFTITALPFPTSLVSRYILTPAAGVAALSYCGLQVLIALAFNLVWLAAVRGGVLKDGLQDRSARIGRIFRITSLPYVLALLLAYPFPVLALGICAAMTVFYTAFDSER